MLVIVVILFDYKFKYSKSHYVLYYTHHS